MAVAGVEPEKVTARSLGFALGPRMNAAGRLETARYAQELLVTKKGDVALERAELLDTMNAERRAAQDEIYRQALALAEQYRYDNVLVVSAPEWNHGIVGIVAAKLLEKYKKPTFVLQELGQEAKGSARSYGDFSAADAIRAAEDLITKGGGHKFAAGVTLPTGNIDLFRKRVNEHYSELKLAPQASLLFAHADVSIDNFSEVNESLLQQISQLEPFGNGNPEPIFVAHNVTVVDVHRMGSDAQHLKLRVNDTIGASFELVAFSAPESWFAQPGEVVSVWFEPMLNEWRGVRSVEGRLLNLEST